MPRFTESLLQAIPLPALVTAQGRVACFNEAAAALFPSLGEGGPLPDGLSAAPGAAGLAVIGPNCWTYRASPVDGGTLLLLSPSRSEGLSGPQLDGTVRQLREQTANLMLFYHRLIKAETADKDAASHVNAALCRLQRIVNRLDLMHELTDDSFCFMPRALDLVGLCRDVTEVTSSLLGELEIRLTFETPLSFLQVEGSQDLLNTLLLELIDNAARAAGRGGELRMTLARRGERALLTLSGGGGRDDGRPLDAVLAGLVGKERVPQPMDGAGVGLAVARKILVLHGGSLVMERQEGVQATVSLPLAPPDSLLRLESPRPDWRQDRPRPELIALSDLLPDRCFTPPERKG